MEKEPPPPYSPLAPPPYSHAGTNVPPPKDFTSQPGVRTVYVTQTVVPIVFGPRPIRVTCPYCQETMTTSVRMEPNTKTHLWALLCCVLGCWPCFWLPYVSDECLSKKHYCRNCKAFLGIYSD